MQSKGAKNFIVVLMFVIFGGVVYFIYGPNSSYAQQKEKLRVAYKSYVQQEATLVSSESNGRIGKGANIIYTIQYKDPKTNTLLTVKEYGKTEAWDHLSNRNNGDKINVYVNPEAANEVISEVEYNNIMD